MGILDKVTALLPSRGAERRDQPPARGDRRGLAPTRAGVRALRDDLDRWLQLVDDPWSFQGRQRGWLPSTNVYDTGDEVVVSIEVPGLESGDLELMITPDGLTVRGEKREEREDRRSDLYVTERRYGRFVRTMPLPPGLDVDRAEARITNGVLTVRFPKAAARTRGRRIPIAT